MGEITRPVEPVAGRPGDDQQPFALSKSRLVIGEGKDECQLLGVLTERLGISQAVQLTDYGGKDRLGRRLGIMANGRDFREGLDALLLLRDADDDAVAALQSVQDALGRAMLPVPTEAGEYVTGGFAGRTVRVGILILPGFGRKTGSLETLCYRSATDSRAKECVTRYLRCLAEKKVELPANRDKTRAYAYIATGKRAGFAVGRAAQQGYWDFDHAAWNELKTMLMQM